MLRRRRGHPSHVSGFAYVGSTLYDEWKDAMTDLTPAQAKLAQEHGRLYYRIEHLRRSVMENATPESAAELADAEVEYDRMSQEVARLAQQLADHRTDERREKLASIQKDIERLPASSSQRAAAQAFLDDAALGAWEVDEWQTKIRRLMQGEVDIG